MALYGIMSSLLPSYSLRVLLLVAITLLFIRILYRLSPLHPLSHIPGPLFPKCTSLWLLYHAYLADECTRIHALHAKYGRVVRTGPDSVHTSSGEALHDIYSGSSTTKTSTTGFLKPGFYSNFDIDGHISIFSAIDPSYRAVRAKAVTGIFSAGVLRKGQNVIEECVKRFVARLEREKVRALLKMRDDDGHGEVDVLNVARGLAIDTVTAYLFGKCYGGCDEDISPASESSNDTTDHNARRYPGKANPQLSASPMVNFFVAVGRFWYLPPYLFSLVDRIITSLYPDHEADASISHVDAFVSSVIAKHTTPSGAYTDPKPKSSNDNSDNNNDNDSNHKDTYPSRLLKNSITPSETHAQAKDLIFAGTDSTAMTLATAIHHLSANPSTLQKLKTEITSHLSTASSPDEITNSTLQSLPYLRATIRESLRLAMANPTRLPRLVPPSGWTFMDKYIPPGTVVGCSSYELHFNPDVFHDPKRFRPERWIEAEGETLERMNRDFIPFGMGPRQCIARNLATVELFWAVWELVRSGLLEGSQPVNDEIEILEWFNSRVVGEKIGIKWTPSYQ